MTSQGLDPQRSPSAGPRRTIPLQEITLPHQCPRPVRMYVLARTPYFLGLAEAELGRLDDRMRTHTYDPDAPSYRAGDRARSAEPTSDIQSRSPPVCRLSADSR